ncbi:MAG: lipopolysaccharide transport periplasmic protein LptA [Rhodobacteraceae bacterium]|nr:lipopolysaccharide transport periplasmic protein LptA [Paracoccaceae bacterium]
MTLSLRLLAVIAVLGTAFPAHAQGTSVAFGGLKADTSLPVEATADNLVVDQTDGSAVFSGNVVISQGEMRLAAAVVRIEYAEADKREIRRLLASGGVTLASGADAAEAEDAIYTIASGEVILTGNVLLTQGSNTLTGQKLTVDLTTGTGRMDGRVHTVLQPSGN